MKYIIVFTIFISFFLSAQEGSETVDTEAVQNPAESSEESAQVPAVGAETASDDSGASNFEDFRPTEEISEDLSVPFPADI